MYRTELMQPSKMYLIMVIGIRKYQMSTDKEELLRTLLLVNTCDESTSNACVYRELLEAFIGDFSEEYIDYKIEDMDVESYHHDVLMSNFKVLRECESDTTSFLTLLEGQLQSFAYREIPDGDSYDENANIAKEFMIREKLLYSSMIYKDSGIVLREEFVFIKL